MKKASAFLSQANAGFLVNNVFNGWITSSDVAINNNKQTSLSQVTNYDLYAINTSGNNVTYVVAYTANSSQYDD